MIQAIVASLRSEARQEAQDLLRWWADILPDPDHGGFYGEIDLHHQPVPNAPKSAILNTRLLWFFSAMATHVDSNHALLLARRAADYLHDHFLVSGRLVWTLDHTGKALDTRHYAHAQGYAIYALTEYYRASGDVKALITARAIRDELETHFWTGDGYADCLEGVDHAKTLGAHLHVMEGYTHLHRIAPDDASQVALRRSLDIFVTHFVREDAHVPITIAPDWRPLPSAISYGHDAETSWLIRDAAMVLQDASLMARALPLSLSLARLSLANRNDDGGLPYQDDDRDGEWWGQAEGLIAFVSAWQVTGDTQWLDATDKLWRCLKTRFGARSGHEWSWYAEGAGRQAPYQAGMWKCPFHTGRAMLELERRLSP